MYKFNLIKTFLHNCTYKSAPSLLFLLLIAAVVAVALITSSSHFNFQFFLYTIKIINENFFILFFLIINFFPPLSLSHAILHNTKMKIKPDSHWLWNYLTHSTSILKILLNSLYTYVCAKLSTEVEGMETEG